MKIANTLSILVILLFIILWNCDSPNDSDKDNMAILNGVVTNAETSDPVLNAVVVVIEYPQVSTFTDENGAFYLELEVQEAEEVQLRVFKESFVSDTLPVLAVPGRTIADLAINLEPTSSTPVPSGQAASIILFGVNPSSIGVRESGAPEVAEVAFQVQDSAGIPVDLNNSVQVSFVLGSGPGGGSFISPARATTGTNGLAKTSLFSGTTAGVVQIIAEAILGGEVVRSKPVAVTIHGGLPDSTFFSLAVDKLNFPGYNIYGLTDRITAYVGDKYSNPVKPGTAVYFSTTGGIIEGSSFTNPLGQASVSLISAAPKPFHPDFGAGFATVTGRTIDENQNQIEAQAIVLFSGVPLITINPPSIDVQNNDSQTFNYTVSDQNGNPLAETTTITVTVENGDLKAVGNINLNLPDTQNRSWTNFSFTLTDSKPDTVFPSPASVKITTSGPNGNLEYSIFGTAR